MKATEQYFPVVLFILMYKVVLTLPGNTVDIWDCGWNLKVVYKVVLTLLTLESVGEIFSVSIQMKATEQYFLVVLFILLYKVVLAFESSGEI